jgi:hypothetical protein
VINWVNDWTTKVGELANGSADPWHDLAMISGEVSNVMNVATPAMSILTNAVQNSFEVTVEGINSVRNKA